MNVRKLVTATYVDILATYSGAPAAQVYLLGPKVGGHPALFCIRQKKPMNSPNGCDMITPP